MSETITRPQAPSTNTSADRSSAFHAHLRANEADLVRHNIVVRVRSINANGRVAFCTVEQRLFGLCRRKRTTNELLYRAEQALAPLANLGLVPMVTVLHPVPARDPRDRSFRGSFRALWKWLGYPLARKGYKHLLLLHDPFGWRNAMSVSRKQAVGA